MANINKRIKWFIAIFTGGAIGASTRAGLVALFEDSLIGLAIVNVVGALLLGLISGFQAPQSTTLRLFLVTGGIAAFTSWSSLAIQGITSPTHFLAVAGEFIIGVGAAGLGYLIGLHGRQK